MARPKLFGEYMMELGLATPSQVDRALRFAVECSSKGRDLPIGEALVELRFATRDQVEKVLALQQSEREGNPSAAPSIPPGEPPPDPLGRFIWDAGLATPQQIDWAREYASEMSKLGDTMSLWDALVTLEYATREQIQDAAQRHRGMRSPGASPPPS